MWLGTVIYKCWTCSQIYKAFLRTCVQISASCMGKLSKVTTISLLPLFFPSLFLIRATSGIVTALCTRHREDMLSELQPQHCMHLKSLNCPYFSLICTAFLQIFLGYNLLVWRSMELNSDKRYQPWYLHVFPPSVDFFFRFLLVSLLSWDF